MKIYLTIIRSVDTYASERWTFKEEDKNSLLTFGRWILRKILGPLRTGRITGEYKSRAVLERLFSGADTTRLIKAQGIRRLGHLQRMNSSERVTRMLEWRPMGS
jgi:hypothetical protein